MIKYIVLFLINCIPWVIYLAKFDYNKSTASFLTLAYFFGLIIWVLTILIYNILLFVLNARSKDDLDDRYIFISNFPGIILISQMTPISLMIIDELLGKINIDPNSTINIAVTVIIHSIFFWFLFKFLIQWINNHKKKKKNV
jgi:hypothetical protein